MSCNVKESEKRLRGLWQRCNFERQRNLSKNKPVISTKEFICYVLPPVVRQTSPNTRLFLEFSGLFVKESVLILFSTCVHCLITWEPADSWETVVTPVPISLRCPVRKLLTQPWQPGLSTVALKPQHGWGRLRDVSILHSSGSRESKAEAFPPRRDCFPCSTSSHRFSPNPKIIWWNVTNLNSFRCRFPRSLCFPNTMFGPVRTEQRQPMGSRPCSTVMVYRIAHFVNFHDFISSPGALSLSCECNQLLFQLHSSAACQCCSGEQGCGYPGQRGGSWLVPVVSCCF